MENGPFEDLFPIKIGIFHCYVSLPEGMVIFRDVSHDSALFGLVSNFMTDVLGSAVDFYFLISKAYDACLFFTHPTGTMYKIQKQMLRYYIWVFPKIGVPPNHPF